MSVKFTVQSCRPSERLRSNHGTVEGFFFFFSQYFSTTLLKTYLPQFLLSGTSCLAIDKFSSAQSLSCVRLFATPWIAACQASLSITNSQSLLKLMSVESVTPSSPLMLRQPLLLQPSIFPSVRSFQISQFFASGGQSIGVSASASVFPMNIQDWLPLGWIGWISLQSKGLSRVCSNTTVQKYQFFSTQLSL